MPRRGVRPWQAERYGRDQSRPAVERGRRPRIRRIDLHGYDVASAVDAALLSVREAYLNGYQFVELLHGAADVTSPVAAGGGRGGIKWELRRMLEQGQFDAFCRGRHDHQVMEGILRLALRPNPQSRGESWTSLPPPRHG